MRTYQANLPLLRAACAFARRATINSNMSHGNASPAAHPAFMTEILLVRPSKISKNSQSAPLLEHWTIDLQDDNIDAFNLRRAADELVSTDLPVAFPTETVYGLGADATRSSAVKGIYRAKQRPSDNPLIVHVHSLDQVRSLLRPNTNAKANGHAGKAKSQIWEDDDPIPEIYRSLIERFWPGPLTLIMPNPTNSILAPEVTSGLPTFGVRMPKSWLALALLKMANVPLAAPSANASTKPSPTSAEHVKADLNGRITTILDGGPCEVGLESTVVDGLSDPPLILRPGGVSIGELRRCPGWENVAIGYKDTSLSGSQPKAPGMKYRHYSPKATVVLHERNASRPDMEKLMKYATGSRRIGIVRTVDWPPAAGLDVKAAAEPLLRHTTDGPSKENSPDSYGTPSIHQLPLQQFQMRNDSGDNILVLDICLGQNAADVAKGLFWALRELDKQDVDAIFVEGIDDTQGGVATAVMNRLRKASEVKVEE